MTEAKSALETLRPLLEAKVIEGTAGTDAALLELPMKELALDSLEKMELVMKIEETFNLVLDEEDVVQCERVSDLVRLIEQSI
jgi:acyl carrier protein